MGQRQPIQISLPGPCNQNWDDMTPCGKGRFCAQCQKTVIDFTGWSDTALHGFFSKTTEEVCRRFCDTQLNRAVLPPPQPHGRWYRLAVAMGFTLMVAGSAEVAAQTRPPRVAQTDSFKKKLLTHTGPLGTVAGLATDNGAPITGAVVRVLKNNVLKASVVTGANGRYAIGQLAPGDYDVMMTYQSYESALRIAIAAGKKTIHNFEFMHLAPTEMMSTSTTGLIAISPQLPMDSNGRRRLFAPIIDSGSSKPGGVK